MKLSEIHLLEDFAVRMSQKVGFEIVEELDEKQSLYVFSLNENEKEEGLSSS